MREVTVQTAMEKQTQEHIHQQGKRTEGNK